MIDIEAVIKSALRPVLEELAEVTARIGRIEGEIGARIERIEDKACVTSRNAVALELAEARLQIERAVNAVRNGVDGVGIAALSQVGQELTFEFSNGERVLVTLPGAEPGAPGDVGPPGAPGIGHDAQRWAAGVHREGVVVQHFLGRIYRALRDTAAEPGDSADWQRIGSHGLRWCGPIDKARTYECGDLYLDGGTFLVLENDVRHCVAGKVHSPSDIRGIVARELGPWCVEVETLRDHREKCIAQRTAFDAALERLQLDLQAAHTERAAMRAQVTQLAQRIEQLSQFVLESQTER